MVMSKQISQTDYIIYSSEFKFHSYEIYQHQRRFAPLFQVPSGLDFTQNYVILNYHDIQKLLKDPRVVNDVRTTKAFLQAKKY